MSLLAPGQSCIHVLSSSMYAINTCDHPIEIYKSAFHLRHLCISTRLVKATHNIKTFLTKQCYTWHAWPWLIITHCAANPVTLLILLLLLALSLVGYVCSILHALCSVLDQYIYFTTVSCWNHAVVKSRPLNTKQIQHFIQHFEIIQNIFSL
jgi:hypothetical protein